MEQLNIDIPVEQEQNQPVAVTSSETKEETPLLNEVRLKFGIFGSVSLVFGGFFAFGFYKTGIGLNVLLFTIIMIVLLSVIMKKLALPVKVGTKFYYAAIVLLGLSTALTSSEILQFLNVIGILFLLDLSLLHQFTKDNRWDFAKHFTMMFGLAFKSIAAIGMPFMDSFHFLKHSKLIKNDKVSNMIIGIVISLPFLWIIIALLSSADLLFGEMTKGVYQFFFSSDIFAVGIMILFGFITCYCVLCGVTTKMRTDEGMVRKKADASIAVTTMTLLFLVYAVFCGIQVVYLFTNGVFTLPVGYTFADYARRGFFELLAVTIINISLMLLCTAIFKESKILRLILTGITICTYIMIVSATYRMLLYIGAYHLTFLRLLVLLALLIDAFLLAGVIVSEYQKTFPLFRYCVVVIAVCYIAFSFARPDYYIASYLIKQKEILELGDVIFLTEELSLDAAPVVLPLLFDTNRWTNETLSEEMNNESYVSLESSDYNIGKYYDRIITQENTRGIRDFNYSCYMAAQYRKEYPRK